MNSTAGPLASPLDAGKNFQYLNQLCLVSHLRHGHPVTLYCTDTVTNVGYPPPDRKRGKKPRRSAPATENHEQSHGHFVAETSASFLSNVFRYKMHTRHRRDLDRLATLSATALFPTTGTTFFAGHGSCRGARQLGGVVGLFRSTASLMDQLLDYYENLPGGFRPGGTRTSARRSPPPEGRSSPRG